MKNYFRKTRERGANRKVSGWSWALRGILGCRGEISGLYSILPSPIVPCVLGERDINTPWKIQMLTFKRLLSFGESHNWYLRFRRKSRDSQESLIWQYIVILLINVWLSNIYILIIDILTGFFSIDFARSHVLSSFSSLPSALLYRVYTSLVDRKLAIQLLNCVCLTFHSADPIDRFSFADKIA